MLRVVEGRFVAGAAFAAVLICVFMYGSWPARPCTPTRDVRPLHHPGVRPLHHPGSNVQIMDPYKMPVEPTAVCSPLLTAKKHEPICLYTSEEDTRISKVINDKGVWEGNNVKYLAELMRRDPDLGLVDVGANLGVFTLTMASYGRKVVGIEPLQPNLRRLAQSLRASPHIIPFVTIVPMATSDKNEVLHIWTRDKHPGGTQLHTASRSREMRRNGGSITHQEVTSTRVNSTTLDQIVPLLTFSKAILKIDVEGGEYLAFKGAHHFFNSIHIPYIFMEWGDKCNIPERRKFFIDFFRERKYTVHKSTPQLEPLELSEKGCESWEMNIILKKSI